MRHLFQKENTFFWLIILVASILRLWNYWKCSYTHDELSALVHVSNSSFPALIAKSVNNHDTYSPLIQAFLWGWTKIFGFSEAAVRFPFVIAGIGSVAFIYLIAKKWFGFTTACLSSLTIAILAFPILYSRIAAPYSFGLLFTLLTGWCWTNLLFGDKKNIYLKAVFYGTVMALCMLTGYFYFFFSIIIAITGLLFLKKETWKPYLLSGTIVFMIFLLHLLLSCYPFQIPNMGQWLAKPENDYLWKYVLYGFNDSPVVVTSITVLFLLSILLHHLNIFFSKFHFVCIAWLILPLTAGYYYSENVNLALYTPTLLVLFPFLAILIFSFFKETNRKLNNVLLFSFSIVLLYSTIIEQKFFKREDFGVFKEINTAVTGLHKKYGTENITTVLNTSSKEIFDFYFKQMNTPTEYDFFVGDDSSFVADMLKKIDECNTPYFIYGWSNFRSPYEIPEMIKRKFPCIIYDEMHFNSQVTLFGKHDSCKRDTIFQSYVRFDPVYSLQKRIGISYDSTKVDTAYSHSGKHSLKIESKNEFCITLTTTVKKIFADNSGCVNVSGWIYTQEKFNAQLVMNIGQPHGKNDWQAKLLPKFIKTTGKWQEVVATFELPASAYPDDEVKIYLWNPEKNSFFLDDFSISSFADSKYDYYKTSFRINF